MCFDVLGLEKVEAEATENTKQSELIELLIDLRNQARTVKDFKQSDAIRDRLLELGVQLKDTANGTTFELTN
jgi:cysteinyl-tRNA synthetase